MYKMKDKATETVKTTKTVVGNAQELVLAASLVITATYNYYDLTIRQVGNVEYGVRVFASAVIALVGAHAVIKFFNKEK